jgi:UDP-N-acetylglucosamine--N-acetylmuramyl-(pentapeptide) pyrophosphoryl-undecaprenol N-acetylglucosamine transferase
MRKTRRDRQPIYFAASGGGHLELLNRIAGIVENRCWIVGPGPRGNALRDSGEDVHFVRNPGRRALAIFENLRDVVPFVLRERPRLLVTTGAGSVVPLCLLTRLLGGRIIFVETGARVTGPSKSGWVLSRLASSTLVQWYEMTGVYSRATVCRPSVIESVGSGPDPTGEGTFVTVGGHSEPFDRLLNIVDDAVEAGVLPGPVVAQSGSCNYEPRNYDARAFMPPDEMKEAVANARYVVCHGGSSSIENALARGKRPMVLTRLHEHREHVDDHQTQLAGRLAELGLVVLLEDRLTARELERADHLAWPEDIFTELPSIRECLAREIARITRDALSEYEYTEVPEQAPELLRS